MCSRDRNIIPHASNRGEKNAEINTRHDDVHDIVHAYTIRIRPLSSNRNSSLTRRMFVFSRRAKNENKIEEEKTVPIVKALPNRRIPSCRVKGKCGKKAFLKIVIHIV